MLCHKMRIPMIVNDWWLHSPVIILSISVV